MRKLLSVVFILTILLMGSSAFAEEFILRNHIALGDSKEEVLQKEPLSISTSSADSLTTEKGSVSGISDATVQYFFDKNGLYKVTYTFPESTYRDLADESYEFIHDSLIQKYGNPLGLSNGRCYILSKGCLKDAVLAAYLYYSSGKPGDLSHYEEWALDYNNFHVKIEHVEYYQGLSNNEIKYYHCVSYALYSDEELKRAQEKNKYEQAVTAGTI